MNTNATMRGRRCHADTMRCELACIGRASDCGGSESNERWAKVRVNAGYVETADCASTSAARVTAIAPAASASRRQYLQRCWSLATLIDLLLRSVRCRVVSNRLYRDFEAGNNSHQEEDRLTRTVSLRRHGLRWC